MEDIIQKLTAIVSQFFPGSEVELDRVDPERVSGLLIWDGFQGQSHIERQRRVWQVLRKELTPSEQSHVAALMSLTRDETTAARAG